MAETKTKRVTDFQMDRSDEAKKQFASLLAKARLKLDLNMPEMAARIGIPYPRYYNYELAKGMPKTRQDKEAIEQIAHAILNDQEFEPIRQEPEERPGARKDISVDPPGTPEEETKETLVPNAGSDDEDNKSFKEQMEDLGVKVVTKNKQPEQEPTENKGNSMSSIKWYFPNRGSASKRDDTVRLYAGRIVFGEKPFKHLLSKCKINSPPGEWTRVCFGSLDYKGKKCIFVTTTANGGYKMSETYDKVSKAYTKKAGSKKIVELMRKDGFELGVYKAVLVKGGVIAMPEDDGNEW